MGSKIEYIDSAQIYATSYVRNSKAIGVLWAIFTICYAIIGVVSFITPEWIGDIENENPGKFGLWSTCFASLDDSLVDGEQCRGSLEDFISIATSAFQAATVFVGFAVICALLTICAMMLFFFCHSTKVFHICGWLQIISAICMIVGCLCFPVGWDDDAIRKVCGASDKYYLGTCRIRWAYLLAAIGCLDAIILATLAFILATRHVQLEPDPHYAPASHYKGEMNGAFVSDNTSVAGSRKSLNLHPVLLMHPGQDDTYSQFSQRTVPRSTHSGYYPQSNHHHHHNFQL